MATIMDLHGRQVEVGDLVIPKAVENLPQKVVSIGEIAIRPNPQGPPMRQILLQVDITLTVPMEQPFIPYYLEVKADKKIDTVN